MLSIELDEEVTTYEVENQLLICIQVAQDSSQSHVKCVAVTQEGG